MVNFHSKIRFRILATQVLREHHVSENPLYGEF